MDNQNRVKVEISPSGSRFSDINLLGTDIIGALNMTQLHLDFQARSLIMYFSRSQEPAEPQQTSSVTQQTEKGVLLQELKGFSFMAGLSDIIHPIRPVSALF